MNCFLYILENNKGKHYTGITKLDTDTTLIKHNRGEVYSTKPGMPWNLIYFQEYKDYKEARQREKQIKSWHGGATLKRFLGKAADRLMVGHMPLEHGILVRVQVPQLCSKEINLAG